MESGQKLDSLLKVDYGKFFIVKVEDMIRLIKLPLQPTKSTTHTFIQPKYEEERMEILKELAKISNPISDYPEAIRKISSVTLKVSEMWAEGGANVKENTQKLVFPNGIMYNRKKGAFLTKEINPFFELIAKLEKVSGSNENGTTPFLKKQSLSAGRRLQISNLLQDIFKIQTFYDCRLNKL